MKNKLIFPILLLFLSGINAQDRNWQAGSFVGIEQMSMNYTLTNIFDKATSNPTSIHATKEFRIERKWKERWLIQGGLSFRKMKFNPQMYLPRIYGSVFKLRHGEEVLSNPLIHQQELHVLSIPLGIKYNFAPGKRWQPFLSIGANTSFKYHETEIYQEGSDIGDSAPKTLYIEDPGINFFNIGLDLETGIQYQLNPFLKLVLSPGIRMIEFRNNNEKFKKNGDFLFEKQWLNWSQKKLSIGFLGSF